MGLCWLTVIGNSLTWHLFANCPSNASAFNLLYSIKKHYLLQLQLFQLHFQECPQLVWNTSMKRWRYLCPSRIFSILSLTGLDIYRYSVKYIIVQIFIIFIESAVFNSLFFGFVTNVICHLSIWLNVYQSVCHLMISLKNKCELCICQIQIILICKTDFNIVHF